MTAGICILVACLALCGCPHPGDPSLSSEKAITSFEFADFDPHAVGTISEPAHTIAVMVPFATDVEALVPTIVHTGASVSPASGAAQDFSAPVGYTVTAEDGSTRVYTVTVTVASPGTNADLGSLTLSSGTLTPPFAAATASYTASVPLSASPLTVTTTAADSHAAVAIAPAQPMILSPGTNVVQVTVTAESGASRVYTITIDCTVGVTGVTLTPSAMTLAVGETGQLAATVEPSNATDHGVSWSSSDEATASVSPTGLVTAVAVGSATITVTTDDGDFTDSCTVTVTLPPFGTPTGVSVVQDGYPNRLERTAAVYVNAVRMAPLDYKAAYMAEFDMTGLLESYPSVAPLMLHHGLNQAARFHSNDLFVHGLTLQHDSFDGTSWITRITSYYPGASISGEVLSSGSSARSAVNLAIHDNGAADHSFPPLPGDGHRMIIMGASAQQFGVGNASTYWTMDFVTNTPATLPPIVAACHDFLSAGTITFLLDYYDAGGSGPQRISCFVDGVEQPLSLDLGTAAKGTYAATLPTSTTTRSYYFMALDSSGTTWRYPGTGTFMTVGEGSGTTDYVP